MKTLTQIFTKVPLAGLLVAVGIVIVGTYVVVDRSTQANASAVAALVTGVVALASVTLTQGFLREARRTEMAESRAAALRTEIIKVRAPSVQRLQGAMARVALNLQATEQLAALLTGFVPEEVRDATRSLVEETHAEVTAGGAIGVSELAIVVGLTEPAMRAAATVWYDAGRALQKHFEDLRRRATGETDANRARLWQPFAIEWERLFEVWEQASIDLAPEMERYAAAQDYIPDRRTTVDVPKPDAQG